MRRKKDKSNGITALYERLSRDDDNAGEPVKKSFGIADRVRGSPPCSVWVRVHFGAVFIAPVPAFSQACAPGVKSGRYCP